MISQRLIVLTALSALVAPLTVAVRLTPGALTTFSEDAGTVRHLTTMMTSDEEVMGKDDKEEDDMGEDAMGDDENMMGDPETMDDMGDDDMEMETVMVSSDDAVAPAPLVAGCSSIVQLATITPDLSTLVAAVSAAPEVAAALSSPDDEYTVFAPNNEAFAMLPQEPLMALLKQVEALTFILDLHIVPGTIMAADLMDGDILETVSGFNLTVSVVGGNVTIMAPEGGEIATVVAADVEACNGVVHIIDSVLIPGGGDDDSEGPSSLVDSMGGYGSEGPMGDDDVEVLESFQGSPMMAPVVTTPITPPVTTELPMEADDDDEVVITEPPMEADDDDDVVATEPPMEADDDDEVVEKSDEMDVESAAVPAPVEVPTTPVPTPTTSSQGKFGVCITGTSETFGPTVEQREYKDQGSALTVTKKDDGAVSCSWEEYAGGFDGMPSPLIDDNHENGLDMAIKQMLPSGKAEQEAFLKAMIDKAAPEDLDFPQDKARADGGVRMSNIGKLNAACSSLLYINC